MLTPPSHPVRAAQHLVALTVFVCLQAVSWSPQAEPAAASDDTIWRKAVPLSGLYERIAEDLKRGSPLIISSHYGMWAERKENPENNLNWGMMYGHATLMRRARTHKHVKKHYRYRDWTLVYESKASKDPIRTLVFHQRVAPNKRWRAAGVKSPFDAYVVMQAHEDQEGAATRAVETLRGGLGRRIELDDGVVLKVGDAQITGYFGHNFFYDYEGFQWGGLRRIKGRPDRAKGFFAVGCRTARVPGFPEVVGHNVHALLFSRSLMASEGYSTLALLDGVLAHMNSRELVHLADRTYQYFQKLPDPARRVGSPFVSHNHRMYPSQ